MTQAADSPDDDDDDLPSKKKGRGKAFLIHELHSPGNRAAIIAMEKQSFEIAFEQALEAIADGRSLHSFCTDYHTLLSPSRFRTWIYMQPKRKEAYLVAKALWAEQMEEDMVRIADGISPDGTPSLNDTSRSQLMVNTRKWLMQVNNRKRYGDVKHIEQTTTTTVDLTNMSQAQLQERILNSLGIQNDVFDMEDDDDQSDTASQFSGNPGNNTY